MIRAALSLALAAATSLALASCVIEDEPYPCGPSRRVCTATAVIIVSNRVLDLGNRCGGDCEIVPLGGQVGLGQTYHPAERGLTLRGDARARVNYRFAGAADGASVSFNARCDPGTSLRFAGDGRSTPSFAPASGSTYWQRNTFVLRQAERVRESARDAFEQNSEVAFEFVSQGSGSCQVGRLQYLGTARVCTRWEDLRDTCYPSGRRDLAPGGATSSGDDAGNPEDAADGAPGGNDP